MKRKKEHALRTLVVTILVFVLLLGVTISWMNTLGTTSDEEQVAIVEESLRHALMTCYAVEGGYPEDVQYLKNHYGLMYDEEKISVYYDIFASNIMPDVHVSMRGADAQ